MDQTRFYFFWEYLDFELTESPEEAARENSDAEAEQETRAFLWGGCRTALALETLISLRMWH